MSHLDPSKNIILSLVAENENQVLRAHADIVGSWLSNSYYQYKLIDLFAPSGSRELQDTLAEGRVAFAFAFAGIGSRLTLNTGVNLWTAKRIPFISLWFDHPAYNYRQHIVDSPFVVNAYHVRDHLEARQKFLPPCSSDATMLEIRFGVGGEAKNHSISKRRKKILYAKTGKNPELIRADWAGQPSAVRDTLYESAACAVKDRNLDLAATVFQLMTERGLNTADLDLFMGITQEVDDYIRAWRSDRLARALLRFPAHIVGRGWEYLKPENTRADFRPPIPFSEFSREILDTKIIANTNPLWRDGIHERAINAMHFGNILLTDRSEKSEAWLNGLPNYAGFEWHDDLSDVIAATLKLADESGEDFASIAEPILNERIMNKAPDYVAAIFRIAGDVQLRAS